MIHHSLLMASLFPLLFAWVPGAALEPVQPFRAPAVGQQKQALFGPGKHRINSNEFMGIRPGMAVRVGAPENGSGVELEWHASGVVSRSALEIPRAKLLSLYCGGVVGNGRLLVGGKGRNGAAKLAVFEVQTRQRMGLRNGFHLKSVLKFRGLLQGEVPLGVLPLHGVPGHALLMTGPKGTLYDIDLTGKGSAVRVIGKEGVLGKWGKRWDQAGSQIDGSGHVTYQFARVQERRRGYCMHSGSSGREAALSLQGAIGGQLRFITGRASAAGLRRSLQDCGEVAWERRLAELNGLPPQRPQVDLASSD